MTSIRIGKSYGPAVYFHWSVGKHVVRLFGLLLLAKCLLSKQQEVIIGMRVTLHEYFPESSSNFMLIFGLLIEKGVYCLNEEIILWYVYFFVTPFMSDFLIST